MTGGLRHKLRRVISISPAEFAHRFASLRWKQKERGGYRPPTIAASSAMKMLEESWQRPFYFRSASGKADAAEFARLFPDASRKILEDADAIVSYKVRLFGKDKDFAGLPDWHRDWSSGIAFPREFYGDLNVLEPPTGLSVKRVWELNRHQFLTTLGQAYFLSKDEKYATSALAWMTHWIDENPPYIGINWFESLEVGLRLLSWTWTLQLLRGATMAPTVVAKIMSSMAAQFEFIQRHLSTYSSPNTHLLGEHLALFVVAQTFPELPNAGVVGFSKNALEEHMRDCVEDDGSYFEKSAYYHGYALDMFLQAAIIGKQHDVTFSNAWQAKLRKMTEFLATIIKPNGMLARFGDDDGGRTLRLGESDYYRAAGLLQACEAFCSDARTGDEQTDADVCWLQGNAGVERLKGLPKAAIPTITHQRESDISIHRDAETWLSLQGDSIARGTGGHSHSAFLSVELTYKGYDVLIDPGTYAYENEWRNELRSPSAHNGVEIDFAKWVEAAGPFKWKGKAPAIVHRDLDGEISRFLRDGQHDFSRSATVTPGKITIENVLDGGGEHTLVYWFHFAPECEVRKVSENEFDILVGTPLLRLKIVSERKVVCALTKGDAAKQGWSSPRYDEIVPSFVLRVDEKISLPGGTDFVIEQLR